jgi:hypothetical protein
MMMLFASCFAPLGAKAQPLRAHCQFGHLFWEKVSAAAWADRGAGLGGNAAPL